jgi:sigma-B regulation protein RsbU (phosphoserine phosphatase)
MASLKVLEGLEPGQEFPLEGQQWVMGRSPECDVVLEVAAVSRRHAILSEEGGQFFVQDLGSRNGTYINGTRVGDRAPIRNSDQMLICDILFEFLDDELASRIGGIGPDASSLLAPLGEGGEVEVAIDDGEDEDTGTASIMATLDVSGGIKSSWNSSAKPEAQLEAMIEISNNLGNTLSAKEILPKILDSLFKIFVQADRGFVIMPPKPDAPLVPVAAKARREDDKISMRISRTIVRQAITDKKAILSADAATDERFSQAQSIADFQIRSLIVAPILSSDGEALGVIQIDTNNQRSRFTDLDLQILAGVASQASIALDNARMVEDAIQQRALQRDLEVAHQMQHALLPSESPQVSGYHFFEFYESALQVGGDYYDYISLPDDRIAAVVGDVAGKGVSAAILMAKLSSDVRFWLAREPDAAKALGEINAAFSRHGWDDRFVTMVVAVLDPHSHKLTLVNAGHMPPLLRDSSGEVIEIGGEEAGLPLGVIDDYEYEAYERELLPGDFATVFTDGFSEAMNSDRDLFGMERLTEVVGDKSVGSHELGEFVLKNVRDFAGDYPQSDDMCLVCFGRE